MTTLTADKRWRRFRVTFSSEFNNYYHSLSRTGSENIEERSRRVEVVYKFSQNRPLFAFFVVEILSGGFTVIGLFRKRSPSIIFNERFHWPIFFYWRFLWLMFLLTNFLLSGPAQVVAQYNHIVFALVLLSPSPTTSCVQPSWNAFNNNNNFISTTTRPLNLQYIY